MANRKLIVTPTSVTSEKVTNPDNLIMIELSTRTDKQLNDKLSTELGDTPFTRDKHASQLTLNSSQVAVSINERRMRRNRNSKVHVELLVVIALTMLSFSLAVILLRNVF